MHDPADERRRQRREFIRTHHPDRGGDPRAFIAGLVALDDPLPAARPPQPRVVIVADVAWPVSIVTAIRRRLGAAQRPPRVR